MIGKAILAICGLLLTGRAAFAMSCATADTMRGLMTKWAEGSPVSLRTETALSADGFSLLLAGEVDCVAYVREPFKAELDAYRAKFGGEPKLIPIAGGSYATRGGTHAIAIFVNKANPIDRLTMDQLSAILTGRITDWREVGAGSGPIRLYSMLRRRESGNPPGIVNFMQTQLGAIREDAVEIVDQPGETSLSGIVRHVAADRLGIGFSGFAFAQPGAKTVKLAPRAGGPFYAGSEAEVAQRLYPLSRTIYLMLKPDNEGHLTADQRGFVDVILSPAGQKALQDDPTRFLPLTAQQLAEARQAVVPAKAGPR
jgi:phosphate transport system substrate-binding protein